MRIEPSAAVGTYRGLVGGGQMIDETLTELARKQVKGLGELEVKQGSVAILQNAGRRVELFYYKKRQDATFRVKGTVYGVTWVVRSSRQCKTVTAPF
ncbi:MAG: hypothetical protein QMD80_03990 [archaeon]|nr:hypothetical protein [archaeon]